jgi:hypothetical protein
VCNRTRAGVGAARVRTETVFAKSGIATAPGALGIQVGRDLSITIMKPTLLLGGGVRVPIRERVSADVGVRYNLIFSRTSEIPADVSLGAVRLQAGIGVRFGR